MKGYQYLLTEILLEKFCSSFQNLDTSKSNMRQSPTAPSPSAHKADFKLIVMYFAKSLRTLKIDRRILKHVNKAERTLRYTFKFISFIDSLSDRRKLWTGGKTSIMIEENSKASSYKLNLKKKKISGVAS